MLWALHFAEFPWDLMSRLLTIHLEILNLVLSWFLERRAGVEWEVQLFGWRQRLVYKLTTFLCCYTMAKALLGSFTVKSQMLVPNKRGLNLQLCLSCNKEVSFICRLNLITFGGWYQKFKIRLWMKLDFRLRQKVYYLHFQNSII
jgi:hypothetical protein